jgi:orotidine-5'-phosphate decarboxylase
MLRAAAEAAAQSETKPKVLAVTVLTSLSDADLQEIGVAGRAMDQVLRLAQLARVNGCLGVVASAREAKEIRREIGEGFLIVTPGVRPAGADLNDQTRHVTPAEAIAAGATHIVVGRPIIAAADPAKAARSVIEEMESAVVAR